MASRTGSQSKPRRTFSSHEIAELKEFRDDYVGAKREFDVVASHINRLPIRKAAITSARVIRGLRGPQTYICVDMDLEILEGRDLLDDILGPEPTHSPQFTVRLFRHFVEDSTGGTWQHLVQFFRGRGAGGRNSTIVMEGAFPRLRLFHAFDLVRIITTEFKQVSHPSQRADYPSDEDFAFVLAGVLHRFSSDWRMERSMPVSTMLPFCHPSILEDLDISSKFFGRWCDEEAPTPFSLGDFSTWSAEQTHSVRALPKDNGPLFVFHESRECFRRRLQGEPILEFTLVAFCRHILEGQDPPEAYATIAGITRYKMPDKLKHEFVILRGLGVNGLEFWLRIDRAALRDNSRRASSSTFPADDKVRVASTEAVLLDTSASMEFAAQYGPSTKRFNIRELAKVLDVFSKESPDYVFPTANCYFLASLVQEVVTTYTQSSPAGRTWALRIPTKTFGNVIRQYQAIRSVSCFQEEEDAENIPTSTRSAVEALENAGGDASSVMLGSESAVSFSRNSSTSRRSSLMRATRKFTNLFKRRQRASSPALDAPYTEEPESMQDGEDVPVVDTQTNGEQKMEAPNGRARKATLSGRVRTILSHVTTKKSTTTDSKGTAHGSDGVSSPKAPSDSHP